MSPGNGSPDCDGVRNFGLDLAIVKEGYALFRLRAAGKGREWLRERYSLEDKALVIPTLASDIAIKALRDNLTFLVSFED